MLCLHGYPETLQLYGRLACRIDDIIESTPVDWPGLGGSDPFPGSMTPEARADHAIRILDGLGIDRAFLFGTDMGGPPALITAAKYPDRIYGVVVSNSLLYGDGQTSTEIELIRQFPLLGRMGLRYAPRTVFERCLETFLPASTTLDPNLHRAFWRYFRRRNVRERLIEMIGDYDGVLDRVADWYDLIQTPVLACWGRDDYHFPPAQGLRLANRVPRGRYTEIAGGEHWMLLHNPAGVERALRSWFSEISTS